MKKVFNFVSDWIWQLPQNLVGVIYGTCIKKYKYKSNPYNDCVAYTKYSPGAVTLGKYVFLWRFSNNKNFTIKHEHGHVKQSKILGPLYLLVIGLPSIVWACLNDKIAPNKSYYWFYTEHWANKLSGVYENKC